MSKSKRTILVAGATGTQGGAVARQLLSKGYRVRAMTRNPGSVKANALQAEGAELIRGDFADRSSLESAMVGAWGVFSIQNAHEGGVDKEEEDGKCFADVARAAGVACFVYTGVGGMTGESGVPHYDSKHRIVRYIRELEFPAFTIIGPTFFMENFASDVTKIMFPELADGRIVMSVQPSTRLQLVAVADIARAAVAAIERPESFNGKTIDLAGDDLSLEEIAQVLSRAWGLPIAYEQAKEAGLRPPSWQVTQEWYRSVGWHVDIPAVERLLGFALLRFEQWAATHDPNK